VSEEKTKMLRERFSTFVVFVKIEGKENFPFHSNITDEKPKKEDFPHEKNPK
jgi:hypothetical protein